MILFMVGMILMFLILGCATFNLAWIISVEDIKWNIWPALVLVSFSMISFGLVWFMIESLVKHVNT